VAAIVMIMSMTSDDDVNLAVGSGSYVHLCANQG